MVQSMENASPARWHLAHTNWFFETFVLVPHARNYTPRDSRYRYVFNSYYDGVGPQFPRAARGTLSRPSLAEILQWRASIDEDIQDILEQGNPHVMALVELGLHHEEQHQELLLTDIKHAFCTSPLAPVYRQDLVLNSDSSQKATGFCSAELVTSIGYQGDGFHFDNEGPAHRSLLSPYKLAGNLVTNAEWLEFMADDGYGRHDL